jgi:hypothetical protein
MLDDMRRTRREPVARLDIAYETMKIVYAGYRSAGGKGIERRASKGDSRLADGERARLLPLEDPKVVKRSRFEDIRRHPEIQGEDFRRRMREARLLSPSRIRGNLSS